MVRKISVRLLTSSETLEKDVLSRELLELAAREFPALMNHPDLRQDCLQELRLVEVAEDLWETQGKVDTARRALAWLSHELGLESAAPPFEKPEYLWCRDALSGTRLRSLEPLPALEEGTFLADLSDMLEAARSSERRAA